MIDNNSTLANYCEQFYRLPGVAEQAIALQDEWGIDVNVLLLSHWLATQSIELSKALLDKLLPVSQQWQNQCVRPLRQARRFAANNTPRESLYQQLKVVELVAEFGELNELEALLKSLLKHSENDQQHNTAACKRHTNNARRYLLSQQVGEPAIQSWVKLVINSDAILNN